MDSKEGPKFIELESAAKDVIAVMKTVPELADERIAAIGGLAVWKYLPAGRHTEDVDFIITASGAPKAVKDKLLAVPNSPFESNSDIFYYKSPNGTAIQIDITPDYASPFIPPEAKIISSVPQDVLPYISTIDLICFKISSCGMRPTQLKKEPDANDAATLLSNLAPKEPLILNKDQKEAAKAGLVDAVTLTGRPLSWWNKQLGLD